MPHIRIRGMKIEEVMTIETKLLTQLSQLLELSEESFTLEWEPSVSIAKGKRVEASCPFVEVHWFERNESYRAKTAGLIESLIKPLGYETTIVYFIPLDPSRYYKNQMHYGKTSAVCPLCKEMNQCAVSLNQDPLTCWCMTTPVPQALRDRVPEGLKGKACICKKCVDAYNKQLERENG